MYSEFFAIRLKAIREELELTQDYVSQETKITRSVLSRYETGKLEPNLETLGILSEFYAVSIDWLLGKGEKKTNYKKTEDSQRYNYS